MRALKLLIILFIVSLFSIQSFSQQDKKILEDSIRNNIYSNPDKALNYLHKYLNILESENNIENIIITNASIAAAHEIMNQTDSTLFYHYKNLSIAEKPKDIIQTKHSIARILENKERFRESLRLYQQTLDLAEKNKDSKSIETVEAYIRSLKLKISKSNNALEELKTDYNNKILLGDFNLRFIRKTLIEAYIKAEKLTEAEQLIIDGLAEAKAKNDCEFIYHMNFLKSKIDVFNNKLNSAKKASAEALTCAIKLKNQEFINEIKYRNAEINFLSSNFTAAITDLNIIIESTIDKTPLQKIKYYKLISDTYKALKDSKMAEVFYYKYLEEKQKVSENKLSTLETLYNFNLNKKVASLQSDFELELDQEILEKEKYKKNNWVWTFISISLIVLIVALFFFFKIKAFQNQKRFNELMIKIKAYEDKKKTTALDPIAIEKQETVKELKETQDIVGEKDLEKDLSKTKKTNTTTEEEEEEEEEETDSGYVIDDKKVEEILIKIQKLEDKQYYLRQDCTMHNMAKKLKTNTSYLSKIVNTHLEKSFSTYINELRINHAILELKNNKRLRSYSVKGIAEEMGYKNADAFSRYFKVATGISPTVYIKKIEEIKNS
ncbi:AraC family transcriptional regulator [uncultured Lacinutrix sp.]|uniref:helix-turn-helix domain-containing protein n=1 Tax=uncultured Lacinutrix sp. TaxID=574032 RepID=UPI0026034884|nr:helix-turn-helix domain-containing protein [uncultured Lacinutrix sp.]